MTGRDRRPYVSVTIVALLAVAGLWWSSATWFAGEPPVAPGSDASDRVETAAVDPDGSVPATATPEDGATPTRRATPVDAPAPDAPGTAPDGVTVRVVDAASGDPVAGATVRYAGPAQIQSVDLSFVATQTMAARMQRDVEDWLTDFGDAITTDVDGLATIPQPAPLWIAARSGDGYVEEQLRQRPRDVVVLQLRADHAVAVEVVDARDRPAAGVDVVVRTTGADGRSHRQVRATTDADGRATIAHAQLLGGRGTATGVAVTVAPVGGELEPVPLEPGSWPTFAVRSMCARIALRSPSDRPVPAAIPSRRPLLANSPPHAPRTQVLGLGAAQTTRSGKVSVHVAAGAL